MDDFDYMDESVLYSMLLEIQSTLLSDNDVAPEMVLKAVSKALETENEGIIALGIRLMDTVLDHQPKFVQRLAQYKVIESLCTSLNSQRFLMLGSIEVIEIAIKCLTRIAQIQPLYLLQNNGLGALFSCDLSFFDNQVRQELETNILSACVASFQNFIKPDFLDSIFDTIPQLIGLLFTTTSIASVEKVIKCFLSLYQNYPRNGKFLGIIEGQSLVPFLLDLLKGESSFGHDVPASAQSLVLRLLDSLCLYSLDQSRMVHDANIGMILRELLGKGGSSLSFSGSSSSLLSRSPGPFSPSSSSSLAGFMSPGGALRQSAIKINECTNDILSLVDGLLPTLPSQYRVVPTDEINKIALSESSSSSSEKAQEEKEEAEEEKPQPKPFRFSEFMVDPADASLRPRPATSSTEDLRRSAAGNQQERTELFEKNPSYIQSLGTNLYALLDQIFSMSENHTIRLSCLSCMTKLLYFSSADFLRELLRDLAASAFIASLLTSSDITFTFNAIRIAEILIQKLPEIFQIHFQRAGVVDSMTRLSNRQFSTDEFFDFDAFEPLVFDWISSKASLFLNKHFPDVSQNVSGSTAQFGALQSLATSLLEITKDQESDVSLSLSKADQVLRQIADILTQSDSGITNFEIINSSINSSLLRFLTCQRLMPDNVRLFEKIFFTLETRVASSGIETIEFPAIVLLTRLRKVFDDVQRFAVTGLSRSDNAIFFNRVEITLKYNEKLIKAKSYPLVSLRELIDVTLRTNRINAVSSMPLLPSDPSQRIEAAYNSYVRPSRGGSRAFFNPPREAQPEQGPPTASSSSASPFMPIRSTPIPFLPSGAELSFQSPAPPTVPMGFPLFAASSSTVSSSSSSSSVVSPFAMPVDVGSPPSQEPPLSSSLPSRHGGRGLHSGRATELVYTASVGDRVLDLEQPVIAAVLLNSYETVSKSPSKPKNALEVFSSNTVITITSEEDPTNPSVASVKNSQTDSKIPFFLRDENLKISKKIAKDAETSLVLQKIICSLNERRKLLRLEPMIEDKEFQDRLIQEKLIRQLFDLSSLVSQSYPLWCEELTTNARFLFDFESRKFYLRATSLGITHAFEAAARYDETKFAEILAVKINDRSRLTITAKIERKYLLESAMHLLRHLGNNRSYLKIEFLGEEGVGLGPTAEFFTLVSEELKRKDLGLWLVENHGYERYHQKFLRDLRGGLADHPTFLNPDGGLFPAPMPENCNATFREHVLDTFRFMGKFVAKSIQDDQIIDFPLSRAFLKRLIDEEINIDDFVAVYGRTAGTLRSLMNRNNKASSDLSSVDALGLTFLLPGFPSWELIDDGASVSVTDSNVDSYVQHCLDWFLRRGVDPQIAAFKEGFNQVFKIERLKMFNAEELEMLICGDSLANPWTPEELSQTIKVGRGLEANSTIVRHFVDLVSGLDQKDRKNFLRFSTGKYRLPLGGLEKLEPQLSLVMKEDFEPDSILPSVSTCTHTIRLPIYSSAQVLRERLLFAIRETDRFEFS